MILTVTEIVSFVKIKVKADVYAPSINISLKTRKFSQEKQKTRICFCLFVYLSAIDTFACSPNRVLYDLIWYFCFK